MLERSFLNKKVHIIVFICLIINLESLSSNDSKSDDSTEVIDYMPVAKDHSLTIDAPTLEDFNSIDPTQPSFTSIVNTTPDGKKWVKLESMSDEFETWDSDKWFKSTWNYGVPVLCQHQEPILV